MPYLIYQTKEEADLRADREGQIKGYAYWKVGSGTRTINAPEETVDGEWALEVSLYELSLQEEKEAVETATFPVIEEEEAVDTATFPVIEDPQ